MKEVIRAALVDAYWEFRGSEWSMAGAAFVASGKSIVFTEFNDVVQTIRPYVNGSIPMNFDAMTQEVMEAIEMKETE